MKEKILALLTAQFSGVRKDGLNHIANVLAFQVDTEEKAKEVVGKLTADQINSFITDWRKEADAEDYRVCCCGSGIETYKIKKGIIPLF